jgi:carboxysome shell carbonic anhydrase
MKKAKLSRRLQTNLLPKAAGLPKQVLSLSKTIAKIPGLATDTVHPACPSLPAQVCQHPLVDQAENQKLSALEQHLKGNCSKIMPFLRQLSAKQHAVDFVSEAQAQAEMVLGYRLPEQYLNDAWIHGLNVPALYAYALFAAIRGFVSACPQELPGDPVVLDNFLRDSGFHTLDITPCADGRLTGLAAYILRLPLSANLHIKAYAGSLFDVEEDMRDWSAIELSRHQRGEIGDGRRYLKVAVYHYSSQNPHHEGCAAHQSNTAVALEAALHRLYQLRAGIENRFGGKVAILLLGVDTDIDAIRVHLPDANGDLSPYRFVDNAEIYRNTLMLSKDAAHLAIYQAMAIASKKTGWGAGVGEMDDGIRRFIATLLIKNLSQIQYVIDQHGGFYPDYGHQERYIAVGERIEALQMRNIAYYAHLDTVEEGAADLDVGIKIFKKLNVSRGLPVPIVIHYRYDAHVPGSRERAVEKARRVKFAITQRFQELANKGLLAFQLTLQNQQLIAPLELIEESLT